MTASTHVFHFLNTSSEVHEIISLLFLFLISATIWTVSELQVVLSCLVSLLTGLTVLSGGNRRQSSLARGHCCRLPSRG